MSTIAPPSEQEPWPVRTLSQELSKYIDRLGGVWLIGQLAQITLRPGTRFAFLTLRDTAAEISIQATCPAHLLAPQDTPFTEGSEVIVHGKMQFYTGRGTLNLKIDQITLVGIGQLLARIEKLRKQLLHEGLFDPARKKQLPFLPAQVGLITGRGGAAEHDVLSVGTSRWPAASFRVENTAVQGAKAVSGIMEKLALLDADPRVEVIIIARGGGSVEDLLPFSNEELCRAVSRCVTPIVSAIGHETDNPLLDYVADVRAATPTHAAKLVIPDVLAEYNWIQEARHRARLALQNWVTNETLRIADLSERPAVANPINYHLAHRYNFINRSVQLINKDIRFFMQSQNLGLESLAAKMFSLSPTATLARGYSLVQHAHTHQVVTDPGQVKPTNLLTIKNRGGMINVSVVESNEVVESDEVVEANEVGGSNETEQAIKTISRSEPKKNSPKRNKKTIK